MRWWTICAALATMISTTGCATLLTGGAPGVPTDGCEWVRPIYLSEVSIDALRSAQAVDPAVRRDREAIAAHNRNFETICR